MRKLDEKKLEGLMTFDDLLNEKYGPEGSPEREKFEVEAEYWYYAELLRDERKRQKMTQKQLADRIGKKREYISAIERGDTDMQLSTFLMMSRALGLRLSIA